MSLKLLNQFIRFSWEDFADGKQFVVTGCSEWSDYNTKQHLGTKVEVVIVIDNTSYQHKEGETKSNLFEKLTFKIPQDVTIPPSSTVLPLNVTATVYGQFRNQLSVKCTDIKVLQPKKD